MFIRLTNGTSEPYTVQQLRRDNPQTGFPKDIPADMLAAYGVYPVTRVPVPDHNRLTQTVKAASPVEIGGEWVQQWDVIDLPIEQQLENTREYAHKCLTEWVERFLQRFVGGVPAAEMASWSTKADRARAYLAGSASAMIETEAQLRGITGEQMARTIVARSDAYEAIIAAVSGLRGVTQAAIEAAETPEAIEAVIEGAMARAEALKTQMGLSDA